jgi:hypothetical protein
MDDTVVPPQVPPVRNAASEQIEANHTCAANHQPSTKHSQRHGGQDSAGLAGKDLVKSEVSMTTFTFRIPHVLADRVSSAQMRSWIAEFLPQHHAEVCGD